MATETCAVCGGGTHEREDISVRHRETAYHFCSDEHREEFERLPERFT